MSESLKKFFPGKPEIYGGLKERVEATMTQIKNVSDLLGQLPEGSGFGLEAIIAKAKYAVAKDKYQKQRSKEKK